MDTKFRTGEQFLRKGRLTVLTDAMFYAMAMIYENPGRIVGGFATAQGRHIVTACWDVEELIANIDLPFGSPSRKVRTAVLASRDRIGDRELDDLVWCWGRLRRGAAAQGIQILDWFVVDEADNMDLMSRMAGLDPWGLWDDDESA